jgi:hypothetical protein
MSAETTADVFSTEYEHELEQWLRRRFRTLCIVLLALDALMFLVMMTTETPTFLDTSNPIVIIKWLTWLGSIGIVLVHLSPKQWAMQTRSQLLRNATRMVFLLGVLAVLESLLLRMLDAEPLPVVYGELFVLHVITCLLLPWRPAESVRPFASLLITIALVQLLLPRDAPLPERVFIVVMSPLVLLPGVLICLVRMRRHSVHFQRRMIGQHFVSMRREMYRARTIHESMFPAMYADEHVRFEYRYLPMRELGGDYIHVNVTPQGVLHATLLDVTGHGLAAALTVNRLYGEIERVRAEHPDIDSQSLLAMLNRYVHYTLLRHNIFVTAISVTIDPHLGRVQYASAGHPPGFLRSARGHVVDLAATGVLLGALPPEDFEIEQQELDLSPGDTIVLYTDGAFEARDRVGTSFGIPRLRQMLSQQPAPASWPIFLESAVRRHHDGLSEDDILIAAFAYLTPRDR